MDSNKCLFEGRKVMPLIFIIIFFFMIKGDRNNWFTGKQFKKIKNAAIGFFVVSILLSAVPEMLFLTMGLTAFASPFLMPIFIIWLIKYARKKNGTAGEKSIQNDDGTGRYYGAVNTKKVESTILPKAASKRRKIIEKFNKKFNLTLTDSQIQRIVDASYYSPEWQHEVEDMTKEYDSVYQWYQGDTAWLRAYIKAFLVQSISSDFQQQKQICFSELDQVFAGADMTYAISQEEVIKGVNDKFFTEFDDISFMIAYRFLEANGRKYELHNKRIVINESETDILARKYDSMPSH